MTVAVRKWSALGAVVITAGLLAGCTGTSGSTNGNGDGGNTASNSLSCNWDAPAVTVETAADPAVKEGELTEVLVGEWQRIGYDIGSGFLAYGAKPPVEDAEAEGAEAEDGATEGAEADSTEANDAEAEDGERDYRFVFSAEGEFVDCQSSPTTDRDESRGDYTVEEAVIDLGDDGKFTALSWNADIMTWKSQISGATIYLQRR